MRILHILDSLVTLKGTKSQALTATDSGVDLMPVSGSFRLC